MRGWEKILWFRAEGVPGILAEKGNGRGKVAEISIRHCAHSPIGIFSFFIYFFILFYFIFIDFIFLKVVFLDFILF